MRPAAAPPLDAGTATTVTGALERHAIADSRSADTRAPAVEVATPSTQLLRELEADQDHQLAGWLATEIRAVPPDATATVLALPQIVDRDGVVVGAPMTGRTRPILPRDAEVALRGRSRATTTARRRFRARASPGSIRPQPATRTRTRKRPPMAPARSLAAYPSGDDTPDVGRSKARERMTTSATVPPGRKRAASSGSRSRRPAPAMTRRCCACSCGCRSWPRCCSCAIRTPLRAWASAPHGAVLDRAARVCSRTASNPAAIRWLSLAVAVAVWRAAAGKPVGRVLRPGLTCAAPASDAARVSARAYSATDEPHHRRYRPRPAPAPPRRAAAHGRRSLAVAHPECAAGCTRRARRVDRGRHARAAHDVGRRHAQRRQGH